MKPSTDHAIQHQGNSADETAKDDANNGLTPGEPESDDGSGCHPALGVECITEPVSKHGPCRPGPTIEGGDIAVNVGPGSRVGKGSGLTR